MSVFNMFMLQYLRFEHSLCVAEHLRPLKVDLAQSISIGEVTSKHTFCTWLLASGQICEPHPR